MYFKVKREPFDSRLFPKEVLELLGGLLRFSGRSASQGSEFLHQAALAAGGVVLVDHTFFRSFIEGADRLQDRFFGLGFIRFESGASLTDGSPSGATHIAVTQATILVLTVSFDL